MRFVTLEEFIKLPRGTVFQAYLTEDSAPSALTIKVGNLPGGDWLESPLGGVPGDEETAIFRPGCLGKEDTPINTDTNTRSGGGHAGSKYLVYSVTDTLRLILNLARELNFSNADLTIDQAREKLDDEDMEALACTGRYVQNVGDLLGYDFAALARETYGCLPDDTDKKEEP